MANGYFFLRERETRAVCLKQSRKSTMSQMACMYDINSRKLMAQKMTFRGEPYQNLSCRHGELYRKSFVASLLYRYQTLGLKLLTRPETCRINAISTSSKGRFFFRCRSTVEALSSAASTTDTPVRPLHSMGRPVTTSCRRRP